MNPTKIIISTLFLGLIPYSLFAGSLYSNDVKTSNSSVSKNKGIILPGKKIDIEKQKNLASFTSSEIKAMDKFIEKNIVNLKSKNSKKSIRNFQRHAKLCVTKKDNKKEISGCIKGIYKYYDYKLKRQKTNRYGWDTRPGNMKVGNK